MATHQRNLFGDDPPQPGEVRVLPEAQLIDRLHDHFNRCRGGTPLKLTADRRAKYRARLRTFTPHEVARAIANALDDPFYRGDNDRGTRYDFPEIVLKNDSAVDRHLHRTRPRDRILDRAARWKRALDEGGDA